MKSILSKTKKYPQSKSTNSNITTKEKKVLSPPKDITGTIGTSNRIDIHEISTQSIIQTSALLHLWNDMNTTPATTSVVVTPTNESVMTNGSETAAASNTTNTLIVVPPFRSFRHHDEMNNNDDNDVDDDSDTVESNGASISEDDDDDSQNAVVVDTTRSRNTTTTATDLEVTNLLSRRNGTSSLNTPNKLCSNIELNDMVISEECSVRVASPLGEPKEVRFMDELDDDYHHNQQEKESFILHEQLRNVLQDLSNEKAQRFRKEKALIKLAKQLKKRNQTIQEYEVKLIQMAKFINTLQLELQSHRALQQEPQQQQQEHESHRDKQVQEANADDRATDQEEEEENNEELVPSPAKTEAKTLSDESSISLLQDTIQALRVELQESQRQIQVLQNQERDRSVPPNTGNGTELKELIVVPTNKFEPSHKTTVTYRIHPFMVMLYLYGIVVVMGTVWYVTGMTIPITNVMIQNVLCAPIRPGTKLLPHKSNGSTMIYEAPWWVPTTTTYTGTKSNFKSMVHNTFCSNVPRTSMHWTGDKLMIYDVTTAVGTDDHWTGSTTSHPSNKKSSLLLQGRGPAGVQFHWYDSSPYNSGYHESQNNNNIIQLLRTHRAGIALPAPWIGSV
jgi:hypothetical protein